MDESSSIDYLIVRIMNARNYKVTVVIMVCIAYVISMGLFLLFQPWKAEKVNTTVVVSDARQYHELAVQLLEKKSFDDFGAFRTPGYPLFIAAVYAVVGELPWVVLLLQILLSLGTCLRIYQITEKITQEKSAAVFALFLATINSLFPVMALQLMSESLFTFIFATGLWYVLIARDRKSMLWFGLAGAVLGMSALVRPIAGYLPLVLLPFIVASSGDLFITRIKRYAVFAGIFLITLFPWQMRNYYVYGYYALSTVENYNLLEYNAARVKSIKEGVSLDAARLELNRSIPASVTNPFTRSEMQRASAINYIYRNPVIYMQYHLKGGVNMMLGSVKSELLRMLGLQPVVSSSSTVGETFTERSKRVISTMQQEYYLTPILFVQLMIEYLAFTRGAILLFRKGRGDSVMLALIGMAYFILAVGMVGSVRFRHPVTVFYLPVAAYGMWAAGVTMRKKITSSSPIRAAYTSK